MKRIICYKLQYLLSLVPFVGLFIAWGCSWVNIYRTTQNKRSIFIHFCIWLIPICIIGGMLILSAYVMFNHDIVLKVIVGLIVSYISCLILAIFCIEIARGIIVRSEKKFLE